MSFTSTRTLLRSSNLAVRSVAARSSVPTVRQHAARRGYASGAAAGGAGGNGVLYGLIGAALVGGGAYYAFRESGVSTSDPTKVKDAASTAQVDYQK